MADWVKVAASHKANRIHLIPIEENACLSNHVAIGRWLFDR